MRAIKNIRLKHYNYKNDGYYFITICTNYRNDYLSQYGEVVEHSIKDLQEIEGVKVDYSIVMPNHLHLIIRLKNSKFHLGEIIRQFKARTSKETGIRFWQPNYYEHVIRSEKELEKVRLYLKANPYYEKIDWNNIDQYIAP